MELAEPLIRAEGSTHMNSQARRKRPLVASVNPFVRHEAAIVFAYQG